MTTKSEGLTDEHLRQIMPHLPAARRALFLPHLVRAMREYNITTELRAAAFLAQLAEESIELTVWEENLNYSAQRLRAIFPSRVTLAQAASLAHKPEAIANHVYGGRNGNKLPGDGWKYRGRSPMQLTFHDNYAEAGRALGVNLVDHPELASTPEIGFRIAGHFWQAHGCNPLADRRQFKAITKVVNGGYNNLEARVMYYERALRVLPSDFELVEGAKADAVPDDTPTDLHVPDPVETIAEYTEGQAEPIRIHDIEEAEPAPAPAAPAVPSKQQEASPESSVSVQKVAQSIGSKVIAGGIPLGGFFLAIQDGLKNPYVLGALVLCVLVGAWLWNESKKRQNALQTKLVDTASSPSHNTVEIKSPPTKPEANS